MTRLYDLLLVSDLDGTALIAGKEIPKRNVDAVYRFAAKGGRISFATGRSMKMARLATDVYRFNLPIIYLNGALIRDPRSGETFARHCLPQGAARDILEITARFDGECGVMAVGEENYYIVTRSEESLRICGRNSLAGPLPMAPELIEEPLFKVLIMTETPQQTRQVREWAGERFSDRYNVVQSGALIVEMMEKGASKGKGLALLGELAGIAPQNTIAIGDSENDREMLLAASISAAPADADESIRKIVHRLLCPCLDGALGMFIEELEHTYPL